MTKSCYIKKQFSPKTMATIEKADAIIEEYEAQDFTLTLRQLFYQFVARDLLPNTVQSYKRLGTIVKDARLAGLIGWGSIEDRTRVLREADHWEDSESFLESVPYSFHIDKWEGQPFRPEVWIEKDALIGVIKFACIDLDVPYFACRGYNSESNMWRAGERMLQWHRRGQRPVILHLGDHDPSGLDMTRDLQERMDRFTHGVVEVRRLALSLDQIRAFQPPPNPAKTTDTRASIYIAEYGHDSWELDALEPKVIENLIRTEVESLKDDALWREACEHEREERELLESLAMEWSEIKCSL